MVWGAALGAGSAGLTAGLTGGGAGAAAGAAGGGMFGTMMGSAVASSLGQAALSGVSGGIEGGLSNRIGGAIGGDYSPYAMRNSQAYQQGGYLAGLSATTGAAQAELGARLGFEAEQRAKDRVHELALITHRTDEQIRAAQELAAAQKNPPRTLYDDLSLGYRYLFGGWPGINVAPGSGPIFNDRVDSPIYIPGAPGVPGHYIGVRN